MLLLFLLLSTNIKISKIILSNYLHKSGIGLLIVSVSCTVYVWYVQDFYVLNYVCLIVQFSNVMQENNAELVVNNVREWAKMGCNQLTLCAIYLLLGLLFLLFHIRLLLRPVLINSTYQNEHFEWSLDYIHSINKLFSSWPLTGSPSVPFFGPYLGYLKSDHKINYTTELVWFFAYFWNQVLLQKSSNLVIKTKNDHFDPKFDLWPQMSRSRGQSKN